MSSIIKQMYKINVRVRKLDEALAFFQNALGAELIKNRGNDTIGEFTGATVRLGQVVFDLVAPTGPDTPLGKAIAKRGPGVDSIAFLVDDLDASKAALKAQGVSTFNEHDYHGSKLAFVHPKDAMGVLMELIQPANAATAREFSGGEQK